MDLARKLTFNEMCEMEERGETCAELEEVHREMASATANLRADFLRQEEQFRNLGFNPREYLDKIHVDSSVLRLTRELESANRESFSSIQKLMEEMNPPAFSAVRSRLADLQANELKRIQDQYSSGGSSTGVASFLKQIQDDARKAFSRPVIPVYKADLLGEAPGYRVHEEIVESARERLQEQREQSETMTENFALLVEQMKTQTANTEKLVNISIAASEGNIASKKRNDHQFIVMVILSIAMAWGSLPTIVSSMNRLLHWFRFR